MTDRKWLEKSGAKIFVSEVERGVGALWGDKRFTVRLSDSQTEEDGFHIIRCWREEQLASA